MRTYPSRTFVYKRAFLVNSDRTLADMLAAAIQERDTVASRQQASEEDGGSQHFINTWKDIGSGFWAGTLFQFTQGQLPVGFSFDAGAKEVSLSVLAQLEAGTHLLKSALHFGVMDNHVVLMPTSAIRASDLHALARTRRW